MFTAVLERAMRADGQRVEVLNAGVIGYDATQEFVLLATVLLDYRPDAILLFDGWNDFYISGTSPPGADALMNLTFREIDELLEERRRTLANLVSGSALLRRAIRRPAAWRRKGAPRRFGTYADNEALALPRYRTALERACRLAKAYDVAVILAPQPELFCRGGTIPDGERALRATHEESGYADLSRAQYRHFVDVAAAVAREEGTHYFDCTTAFDALEHGCFTDFVHLNDPGNARLAACLRPVVERALLRP